MIIVEGPDGSGKTTLVELIEHETGLVRQPRAVSKEAKALVPIGDYIEQELYKGFGWRLYDRFALISSPAYAMLPNRTFVEPLTDLDWLKAKHHQFQKIDPLIIVCLPPLATVITNVMKGEDNLVVQRDIETIYINYLNFAASQVHNTSCMVWDYTSADSIRSTRLKQLLQWAKGRSEYNFEERMEKKWKTSSD